MGAPQRVQKARRLKIVSKVGPRDFLLKIKDVTRAVGHNLLEVMRMNNEEIGWRISLLNGHSVGK
jgi:hypothetical protein